MNIDLLGSGALTIPPWCEQDQTLSPGLQNLLGSPLATPILSMSRMMRPGSARSWTATSPRSNQMRRTSLWSNQTRRTFRQTHCWLFCQRMVCQGALMKVTLLGIQPLGRVLETQATSRLFRLWVCGPLQTKIPQREKSC